jgi:hypothetical protein
MIPFRHEQEDLHCVLADALLEAFAAYSLSSHEKSASGLISVGANDLMINASLICSSDVAEHWERLGSIIKESVEEETFSACLSDIYKCEEICQVGELKRRASTFVEDLSGVKIYVTVSSNNEILAERRGIIFQSVCMSSRSDDITYDVRIQFKVSEFTAAGMRLYSSWY